MGRNYASNTDGDDTVGKVTACKAIVSYGLEQPLVMEEILVDPPQKMEVRIKILFTSICHTDLSAWQGEAMKPRGKKKISQLKSSEIFLLILLLEIYRLVESMGEGVTNLEIRDHVAQLCLTPHEE